MGNPVVELFNETIFLNTQVALIDLFNFTDPEDGDALDFVIVDDYQSDGTGGQFIVNGIAQPNGGRIRVEAEDLANVFYRAGSRIAWEGYRVIAYDVNGEHSAFDNSGRLYTVRENVTRPTVQDISVNALANELTSLAPFLRANDLDGYPIAQWLVGDTAVDNGVMVFKGVDRPQGERFIVLADEVDQLFYRTEGPASTERLDKFAYDGELWSRLSSSSLATIPNVNRPVAQFNRADLMSEEIIDFATLVNLTDDDTNSMKYVEIWNTSPHTTISGTIFVDGVAIAPKQWERVSTEQLDEGRVLYQAPNNDFDDHQIRYRGFDGKFLSNNGTISFSTEFIPPPTIPAIGNPGMIYEQQLVEQQIQSLFPQIDSGRPLVQYQLMDQNDFGQVSARYEFNTNKLAAKTIHTFSVSEIANNVRLKTGDYNNRSLDDMYVRAQNEDGLWSKWERLVVRTEPEYIGAHDDSNDWADVGYGLPRDAEGRLVLSYSFMQDFPDYETGEATDPDPIDPPEYFSALTQEARVSVRRAFDYFEEIANVKYVEVSDQLPNVFGQRGGIFRFGNYGLEPDEAEAVAFTWTPSFAPNASDVWYNRVFMGELIGLDEDGNPVFFSDTTLEPGTSNYTVHLHELMHAHGYMHSYEDANGSAILPPDTNSAFFSVLSIPGGPSRPDGLNPITPQLYDVETIQRDYGINPNFASGDTIHSLATTFSERPDFAMTLWDAGGNDTLSLEGSTPRPGAPNAIDLTGGSFSSINGFRNNVSIAFRADIENAIGSVFPDTIRGNEFDNVIDAGDGDDVIEGRVGNDTITGGAGDDIFEFGVGDGDDVIDEQRLAGRDTIRITDFADKFTGGDSLAEHFRFRKEGRDLIVSLHLDDQDLSDGSIRISNHAWGAYQVETLDINGAQIDLRNLGQQATALDQKFQITTDTSDFGNLVTPV